MSGKAKFGIAFALMFVALATAPAVQCLTYLAQDTQTNHSCCPKNSAPASVTPTCCIHSPAITSHTADVQAPMIASTIVAATDPVQVTFGVESVVVDHQDTSPPDCSSILRI